MNNKNKCQLFAIIFITFVSILFITNNPINSNKNNTNQNTEVIEKENEANAEIVDKEEACYEEWLSAAMVSALTLQDDEFQINHIYYKTKTDLNNKLDSSGVYLIYTVDNQMYCKYSKPLSKERQKKGKVDLYTKELGFSTYDSINVDSLNFKNYKEIKANSLNTLISQSLLVSLYEN